MSWIGDYIDYTKEQESPEIFHMWGGIICIASVLNRQVHLPRRSHGVTRYLIYPGQIMAVLVAGSAKSRKSTALEIAIDDFIKPAGVRVISGRSSTEKLLDMLGAAPEDKAGRDAIALIKASELANFLSKRTYAEDIAHLLTELFDAKDFPYNTKGAGEVLLRNPCVTLFAATTPKGLGDSIPAAAQSTGYLSRVLHIYAQGGEKSNALADIDDEDVSPDEVAAKEVLRQDLLKRLFGYRKLAGAFRYSKDGKIWLEDWYRTYMRSDEGQVEGYAGRRLDHMLRVAMVLRVSEFGDMTLDGAALEAADKMLSLIERDFHLCFAQIGQNSSARNQDKIKDIIRRCGGRVGAPMLYRDLLPFFKDILELKSTLSALREAKVIECEVNGGVEWWFLAR